MRCAAAHATAAAAQCPYGALTGNVTYVRDGDTIELGPMAIRFWGVAAPEWDAPGGQEATDAIKDMVLGKQVRCTASPRYARLRRILYSVPLSNGRLSRNARLRGPGLGAVGPRR